MSDIESTHILATHPQNGFCRVPHNAKLLLSMAKLYKNNMRCSTGTGM